MFNGTRPLRWLLVRPEATVVTLLLCAGSLGAANYTSVLLGPTPDQPSALTSPRSLNNAGQAVGFEYVTTNAETLVLWNAGVASVVPMPSGYQLNAPLFVTFPQIPAINASGEILAQAIKTSSNLQVGVLFTGQATVIIGPAPNTCGSTSTTVVGLNAAGHVLGTTSGGSCTIFWVWSNGTFNILQPPEPTHFVLAGIDDADHAIGIRCLNVPIQEGCESGPIFLLQAGKAPLAYAGQANAIGRPNNLDQVTGYVLAGPGSDGIFWLSPTYSVGIPPTGPLYEQSCCYTYPNNGGYIVFTRANSASYGILHEGKATASISGNFSTNPYPFALNDRMQFLAGNNLLSPAPVRAAQEVTSQIEVVQGNATLDPATGRFHQKVSLTNLGESLASPVSLRLDQLSPRAAVYRVSGVSACSTPTGAPYVDLPASFGAAGSKVEIQLEFIDSANAGTHWTPRVLAGAGGR
jgi:hypothetical protein